MVACSREGRVRYRSAAEQISYLLEPKNWIIATTLAVGWHADGAAGLGWGAVAALFAGVVPMAFVSRGVRRGDWADRYVGAKRPRLIVLGFIIASVTVGLALLVGFGAPGELSGYIACMLASVAVLAAITTVWKISIHCAVASGSVTILCLLFGPVINHRLCALFTFDYQRGCWCLSAAGGAVRSGLEARGARIDLVLHAIRPVEVSLRATGPRRIGLERHKVSTTSSPWGPKAVHDSAAIDR
jgi:hypothetical protein